MLILAGTNVEITSEGTRYMLYLGSPRMPGVQYKVETDAATVTRLQIALQAELESSMHLTPIEFDFDDEGDCDRDRS